MKKNRLSDLASLKKHLDAQNLHFDEGKLVAMIDQLVIEGSIRSSIRPAATFREYLLDLWSNWWFYAAILIALLETLLVVNNAQFGVALLARMILGLGMLGFVPGFLTTMVLFPRRQLVTLERIALGIFLSVMISIAVGVLLGLGPYFQPSNNIIILSGYVVLVDLTASYRAYDFSRRLP